MTVKEHLLSRHCNLELHRPVVDETEGVATFYLYSLTGKLTGYQQYRPGASKKVHNNPKEGKYYTYRTSGTFCPFGVESLHLNADVVFLTSTFDKSFWFNIIYKKSFSFTGKWIVPPTSSYISLRKMFFSFFIM